MIPFIGKQNQTMFCLRVHAYSNAIKNSEEMNCTGQDDKYL